MHVGWWMEMQRERLYFSTPAPKRTDHKSWGCSESSATMSSDAVKSHLWYHTGLLGWRKLPVYGIVEIRALTIGQLIDWSVNRHFSTKVQNNLWFQLLTCENFLLFFVLYDSKLNIFRFWTVSQTKQTNWRHHCGLWEIVNCIFPLFFPTFLRRNDW